MSCGAADELLACGVSGLEFEDSGLHEKQYVVSWFEQWLCKQSEAPNPQNATVGFGI